MAERKKDKAITPVDFQKMEVEERILELSKAWMVPEGKKEADVLHDLLSGLDEGQAPKRVRIKPWMRWGVAAAMAMILLITWQQFKPKELVLETAFGEQSKIDLPDGSLVQLNAASRLAWQADNFNDDRRLMLEGEAFFSVEKGGPFQVTTPLGLVKVLGTQLNIYAREHQFWVSCVTGKVKVEVRNAEAILWPGEMVEWKGGQLLKSTPGKIEKTVAWKEGQFHFEETPLVLIFAELERQFGIKIEYHGDEYRKVNVDFSNQDLHQALDVITIPMELTYEIHKRRVVIKDKS